MANLIEDFDFNYAAEESKREFQVSINNLLELQGTLIARLAVASQMNKDGIFFCSSEVEVISNLLLNTCSDLLQHYSSLDHTNRITNKLYKAALKIREHQKVIPLIHVNR